MYFKPNKKLEKYIKQLEADKKSIKTLEKTTNNQINNVNKLIKEF